MIIRSDQMLSLQDSSASGFENRMIERVRTYFPKSAEQLGESQLRVVIQFASTQSSNYKLSHERSIALYLDLMLVLGSKFDQDPQIPWAAEILADPSFSTQADRIDLLHDRGWEYALQISPDFESPREKRSQSSLIEGISEIRQKPTQELPRSQNASRAVAEDIFIRMHTLFPIKTGLMGEDAVRLLVIRAFGAAAKYGIANERGVWLLSALMFVLGTDFDSDPQFPWASEALSSQAHAESGARANHLYSEARNALKRWWGVGSGEQT